ncbi:hypothetical protein C8F04DRAFT_1396887 [Mycena alexandri]|uniref:HMG box domain-containing protein n=1 Tax=Mycena alexandri TaxID=1745969 RepID=A0AAD6X152_9AGAR|nr:hypothetical protein C8F04DRAFT_1396887 [Mycena alexandri]
MPRTLRRANANAHHSRTRGFLSTGGTSVRPPIAFICYRSSVMREERFQNASSPAVRSRLIGDEWMKMSMTERQPWVDMAQVLKLQAHLNARIAALAASDAEPNVVGPPVFLRGQRRALAFLD